VASAFGIFFRLDSTGYAGSSLSSSAGPSQAKLESINVSIHVLRGAFKAILPSGHQKLCKNHLQYGKFL
jgi:hypothetical protein